MFKRITMLKILVFLLITSTCYAQNVVRVSSQSQHPYRHKATDLQSTASPTDGQCASYDSATGTIEWTTCGSGGGGGSSELSGWTDLGTRVVLITSSDTVGIGTLSPITKLEVVGNLSVGINDTGGVKDFNGASNSINFGNVTGSGSSVINNGEASVVGGYVASGTDVNNNGKASIASVYSSNGINHVLGYSNGDIRVTSDTVVAGVTSDFHLSSIDDANRNNFVVVSNQDSHIQALGFVNGEVSVDSGSSDTVSSTDFSNFVDAKGSLVTFSNKNNNTQLFGQTNGSYSISRVYSDATDSATLAVSSTTTTEKNNLFSLSNQNGNYQTFGSTNGTYTISSAVSDATTSYETSSSLTQPGNLFNLSHEPYKLYSFSNIPGEQTFSSAYTAPGPDEDMAFSSTGDTLSAFSIYRNNLAYMGYSNGSFSGSLSYGNSASSIGTSGRGNLVAMYLDNASSSVTGNGNFAAGASTARLQSKILGNYSATIGHSITATGDSVIAIGKNLQSSTSNSFSVGFNSLPSTTTTLFVDSTNVGIGTRTPNSTLQVNGNIATNANTDDTVLVANGTAFISTALPNCNTSTQKINYTQSTNTWDCQTDANTGGTYTVSGTQVDFSDNGTESGDAGLTYNKTTDTLTIAGDLTVAGDDITGGTNTTRFVWMADGTNYSPEAIDLGTDTSGNYSAGDGEAGNALAGDTATAFFSAGTIEHERGGLEADVNAYDGLIGITGGATYNQTGTTTQIIIFDGAGAPTSAALSGDITMTNGGVTTIGANTVALTTDTTGNYAAGDAEAGSALTGDSATGFFSTGVLGVSIGGTGQTAVTDDSVLVGSGTSNYVAKIMPDCTTGTINYTASTNEFSCGTDDTGGAGGVGSSSGDQILFNDGGSVAGDAGMMYNKTTDTITVGTLSSSNTGISYFNQGLQVNRSGGATSADIFRVHGDTDNSLIMANVTADTVGIGVNSPTAKLDVNGVIQSTGFKYSSGNTDDSVMISQGSQYIPTALPPVCDATTGKLLYVPATNSFTCGTDANTGGSYTVSGTQVDFSDAGTESGDAGMVYNKTTDTLTVGALTATTTLTAPNGTAPTLSASGNIAVDTSDDQLKYYGASTRVVPYEYTRCITMENLAAADDSIPFGSFGDDVTITNSWCYCHGTCTTKAQFSLEDGGSNAFTMATPTCGAGGTTPSFATVTTDTISARETMSFDTVNAVSPETDEYQLCVTYTYDSQ